jgi:hypothetical protein
MVASESPASTSSGGELRDESGDSGEGDCTGGVKSEYGEAYGVTSVVDMAHVRIVSGGEIRVARRVKIVRIEVEMW